MEDNRIIALYLERNELAVKETDAAYGTRLYALSYNILRSREDAEESVSDTYMETWKSIPPQRPQYLYAFLASICRHISFNRLDESVLFQQWQSDIFFEETGIDSFLLPDSSAQITNTAGFYYPPYNVDMRFRLLVDTIPAKISTRLEYVRKDYFLGFNEMAFDLSTFRQWDYAVPSGSKLLLAVNNKGVCYIIAEQLEEELLERLVYSKAGGNWMADWWNEQPITDAEAEAILAKYPRIDQGMRPISELLG